MVWTMPQDFQTIIEPRTTQRTCEATPSNAPPWLISSAANPAGSHS
jgi:hypothetical protein